MTTESSHGGDWLFGIGKKREPRIILGLLAQRVKSEIPKSRRKWGGSGGGAWTGRIEFHLQHSKLELLLATQFRQRCRAGHRA